MNGPATSLIPHGNDTTDVNTARSLSVISSWASHAGMATDNSPKGTPWAK